MPLVVLGRVFPIQTGAGSDLDLECGFGAPHGIHPDSNADIIKHLFGLRAGLALVAAVH